MTPLHLAAECGYIKIVNYLCDEGADINIQENDEVNLYAGRLANKFELASFPGKCWIAVWKQQFISTKDHSNSLLYIAGSEKNNYHIKLTNKNTIHAKLLHAYHASRLHF